MLYKSVLKRWISSICTEHQNIGTFSPSKREKDKRRTSFLDIKNRNFKYGENQGSLSPAHTFERSYSCSLGDIFFIFSAILKRHDHFFKHYLFQYGRVKFQLPYSCSSNDLWILSLIEWFVTCPKVLLQMASITRMVYSSPFRGEIAPFLLRFEFHHVWRKRDLEILKSSYTFLRCVFSLSPWVIPPREKLFYHIYDQSGD